MKTVTHLFDTCLNINFPFQLFSSCQQNCATEDDHHCTPGEIWDPCFSRTCKEPTCERPYIGPTCSADCLMGCVCRRGKAIATILLLQPSYECGRVRSIRVRFLFVIRLSSMLWSISAGKIMVAGIRC